MSVISVALPYSPQPHFESTLQQFIDSPLVAHVFVLHSGQYTVERQKCEGILAARLTSGKTLRAVLAAVTTDYFLFVTQAQEFQLGQASLERFLSVAKQTTCALCYADYFEIKKGVRSEHPLIDYQFGSIRDNFEFGALLFFSIAAVRAALKKYGDIADVEAAGLFDLRLKVSIDHSLFHVQEYLYTKVESDARATGEKLFDYVDPRNQAVQKEMEAVATQHLKNVDVYLAPRFKTVPSFDVQFPVEASVVIPVRNREHTIRDAVNSVLQQKSDRSFNVIVVDNHSTDGTTNILAELTARNPSVKHILPSRHDLGIGGCWNEAIFSSHCGQYAVQLDSDDIYSGQDTLQKILDLFRQGMYAMVIGSYRLVNMHSRRFRQG